MATVNKIEKALSIMRNHDWYWMMSETNKAYGYAYCSMKSFVELVATIDNGSIVKAMRDLWLANYEFAHNRCDKENFQTRKAELMAIINQAA